MTKRAGESLYLRLPRLARSAAVVYAGLQTNRTRYASPYPEIYAAALERATWSQERIAEYRDARLRAFVHHAVETVPHYRRLFAELGAVPDDIRTLDDLKLLPTLDRVELQESSDELRSVGPRCEHVELVSSSGSTGTPLQLATCRLAVQQLWATYWRYCHWHGIERGTPSALFAGQRVVPLARRRPPFWHYSPATRQLVMSGWHMKDENLPAYVDELRRRRPPWLHGYVSSIALLASHVVDRGVDLGYQVRWVTVASETLRPDQRAVIEQAFGVPPRQHYANTECAAHISECERGNLHVDEDFAAVELVPTAERGTARIVGTNLVNPVQPLLRYEVNDVVELDGSCGCGRPGRIVKAIDGRIEDLIVLSDGSRISAMGFVLGGQRWIREVQIAQRTAGEVVFRVVRAPGVEPDEESLLHNVREWIGDRVDVGIDYVDRLERSRNGKLRMVVSTAEGSRVPAAPVGAALDDGRERWWAS